MANIEELSRTFWKFLLEDAYSEVEDLISPSCRIQDKLGPNGRGVNGIEHCMDKLKELQKKATSYSLDMSIKHFMLCRNTSQSRFLVKAKVAFKSIIIGIALEWKSGILIAIVINKDAKETEFLVDDTTAPIPPSVAEAVAEEPTPPPQPPMPTATKEEVMAPEIAPLPPAVSDKPVSTEAAAEARTQARRWRDGGCDHWWWQADYWPRERCRRRPG